MQYDLILPTSVNGIRREFEIVKNGVDQIGIELTPVALDGDTAFERIGAPDWKYLEFDLSMWNWVGYIDPDFVLSVVTCDQYGGWSDTGYCDKEYDRMYKRQGTLVDQAERRELLWQMQEKLYNDRPYIQLVQLDAITAYRSNWEGFTKSTLSGLGKIPWQKVHRVE
jgi:peptide/nickel transport system substrate-binding protein